MTQTAPSTPPRTSSAILGLPADEAFAVVEAIRRGFPARTFDLLRTHLAMSQAGLAEILNIPRRTLSRRLREGRFSTEESERLHRLARVVASGEELFEHQEELREFLVAPAPALGERTPLELLDTDVGTEQVLALLWQLKAGVVI